ncbi:MAG: AEC family transporter [Desulfovibrio sp.]|jgi:predicted permease|nr:AEC family transporter [Desulfovibrio sp.]
MTLAVVLNAVQCVLTLVIIGGTGYILARLGWFSADARALLPKLVTQVGLPPCMFYTVIHSFSRDALFHFAYGLLVPAVSILLTFGLSLPLAALLRVPARRRGIFRVSCAFSNTIFIGLPVNLALFGQEALPYVLLYYFANTTFFWTLGNAFIARDADKGGTAVFSRASLRAILSPPMLGFLLGILVLLLEVPMPSFLDNAARYLGDITVPLIIMSLGISLQGSRLRLIFPGKELAGILAGRFLISPLTIILLALVLPLPDLMRQVFIIQSSLPVGASVAILAAYHKTEPEFGSLAVSSSTLLSLITIPVFMVIASS